MTEETGKEKRAGRSASRQCWKRGGAGSWLPHMHLLEDFRGILPTYAADCRADLLNWSRRQLRCRTVSVAGQNQAVSAQDKGMAPVNFNYPLPFLHRRRQRLAAGGGLEGILFRGLQHPGIAIFGAEKNKNPQRPADFLLLLRSLLNFRHFAEQRNFFRPERRRRQTSLLKWQAAVLVFSS